MGERARRERFDGAAVLVTGGMGFIGSNLAIALVRLGARVTILDAMIPGYGGNPANIEPVKDRLRFVLGDIRDPALVNELVIDQDYVFHLAGQVDHILSLRDPFPDIDINVKGTAVLMEALRRHCPTARVIYAGTRGQYGKPSALPVAETAPTQPLGIYAITNLAAEKIVEAYNHVFGVRSTLLRITNTYGPRAQMKHSRFGVVNWFVRLALDDATIPVFGDGRIIRDFLYIDDLVDAMLLTAASDRAWGEIFNVGRDEPTSFRELAETIVRVAGSGRWEMTPFSAERAAQEPGDFLSDITKIRSQIGWSPQTGLDEGLRQTVAYYRAFKEAYW